MKKFILNFLVMFAFAATVLAQSVSDKVEMAEGLYASGKIYVVVAVVLVILFGIILFLVRLDRKLKKLEEKIK